MDFFHLNACPCCNVTPTLKSDGPDPEKPHYVGCSNEIDCQIWPITENHSTPEEAIAAWNNGQTK